MKIRRVAIVTGKDPATVCDLDGGTILVRELAKGFSKKGCAVDLYNPLGFNGATKSLLKREQQKSNPGGFDSGQIKITRFPVSFSKKSGPQAGEKQDFLDRIAMSFEEAKYFSDRKLYAYDIVVITHMAHAFGLVMQNLSPKNKTFVMPMLLGTFYSSFTDVPGEYFSYERAVLSSGVRIQTPSEYERDSIVGFYGADASRVVVVPRGFSPETIREKERAECPPNPRIICANAVKMQKAQHLLLHEAAELRREGISPRIYLIGINGDSRNEAYDDYATALKQRIIAERLEDLFMFYPSMPQERLAGIMQNCDFAVYPSVTETFGKSVLESMSSGLPTIAYKDVKAFAEFMEDGKTGFLVERKPSAIAGVIAQLASDKRAYHSMSKSGIEKGREFHWDVIIDRMLAEFEKMIWGEKE